MEAKTEAKKTPSKEKKSLFHLIQEVTNENIVHFTQTLGGKCILDLEENQRMIVIRDDIHGPVKTKAEIQKLLNDAAIMPDGRTEAVDIDPDLFAEFEEVTERRRKK
jgi:hypothetical protein